MPITLEDVRRMLGAKGDLFYQTVQVANNGARARTFVALFMNKGKWLSLEELCTICDLTESTILCHAIPPLKKFGLVDERVEKGKRLFQYVPILG